MSQRVTSDRPFRARNLALVAGLIAVSLAARSQQPATPPAAPQPPATAPADSVGADSMIADSTATDSLMVDSTAMMTTMAPPPAPAAAPTEWPVDPATGQTLINGEPVVGKVFIMQKTDGTVKIKDVAMALAGEPAAADAAIVGSTTAAPAKDTRRIRTAMVQATLWMMDTKKSAVRLRHYGPTTSGASLGQP